MIEYSALKGVPVLQALHSLLLGQSLPSRSQFSWEGQNLNDLGSGGASGQSGQLGSVGVGAVDKLYAAMNRMASAHKPYLWGGGHAGFSHDGPWDCSGAVSEALHEAGLLQSGPEVSGALMAWGVGGKGKYFTVYANPGHVFIILPDGRAWGTTNSAPGGGVAFHHHPTIGFVARHYPGL